MWNGFCGNLIRSLNRNLLVAMVVLFAALIAFFAYNQRYFTNFVAGAHAVNGVQLAAMNRDSDRERFLRIHAGNVARTGVWHITHDRYHPRGFVDSDFLLATIDGQPMIVRAARNPAPNAAPVNAAGEDFEGRLRPMSDRLRSALSSRIDSNATRLPFYLDTQDYKSFGYMSLVFGIPLLLLGCWLLWRYQQTSGDYANHPFARALGKHGQLEMLVQQVDSETAGAHTTFSKGTHRAELTTHWLIANNRFTATPMRLESIVWIYRRIVKKKLYFLITVGKSYSIVVHDSLGQKLTILLNDLQTGELLQNIAAAAPRAIRGYDKRIARLWRDSKDKSAFLAVAGPQFASATLGEQSATMWR